jgi:hypothetical protein
VDETDAEVFISRLRGPIVNVSSAAEQTCENSQLRAEKVTRNSQLINKRINHCIASIDSADKKLPGSIMKEGKFKVTIHAK